ncbi:MAG: serine hydrolase [bacterium]|nr:serine hydrolase [bacterium]
MGNLDAKLDTIDDFVLSTMEGWKTPGAALAVVQGDDVLLMKGYGQRSVAQNLPVTTQTVFPLASVTKAFTAMGIGLLVDEGKLDWDKPVRDYLPTFKLHDPFASQHITPRDLLCHRSGLPRHDLVWYGSNLTRKEMVEKLAHLEPSAPFREHWQYQNLMYMTAGYLTGVVAGMTWEEFIYQRIFAPLGMKASSISIRDMMQQPDVATGYLVKKDDVREMPLRDFPETAPAGAINSNLSDMVNWLRVHLNGGKFGDMQFVAPGTLEQMHTPQMVMPVNTLSKQITGNTIFTYGLGWMIEPYRGYTMVHHGGNIDGISTMVAFIPQAKIGVIVLTNVTARPVRDVLPYEIFDRLLDLPGNDWNARYHSLFDALEQSEDQGKVQSETDRVKDTQPSHPLEAYVGVYENPGYPDVPITLRDGQLYVHFLGTECPIHHYHYDVFKVRYEPLDIDMNAVFATNPRGDITSVSVPLEPQVKDIVFTRKAETVDVATMTALEGVYALPIEGFTITIIRRETTLIAQITGQGEVELIPYKGLEFNLKDAAGLSIVFTRGKDGQVNEGILKQPGAVFPLKKQ